MKNDLDFHEDENKHKKMECPLKIPGTLKHKTSAGGMMMNMREIPVASENDAETGEHNSITLWNKDNSELQKCSGDVHCN